MRPTEPAVQQETYGPVRRFLRLARRHQACSHDLSSPPVDDDDAIRSLLRFMPAGIRIYMAMSFWTILSWPMAIAHLYDNFGWSPNAGNLTGLSVGGFVEGVLLLSSRDASEAWRSERQYRDFCLAVLLVNVGVVFFRTIIQHWH